ncbi:MAG: glutathione transferase [Rhodoferax sp.]|nr:glutathione transferase [Rhodoferax sp.]
MLTLYIDSNHLSPYAMSAFVALHEKGLPFETRLLDLAAGQTRVGAFAAQSLTRRVPTLVHDDFALSESSAIAEYLDEVFPGPRLYPVDPRQRARARQIQAWLRSDLQVLRQERTTEAVFRGRRGGPLSEVALLAADKLTAAAGSLLTDGRSDLFGAWTIADLDLALMLKRLANPGDPLPASLADYAERQWQRASSRAWLDRMQPA